MTMLRVKYNGTQTNINLNRLLLSHTDQSVTGVKTFDNKIDFTYGSIWYDADISQLVLSANKNTWVGPGAKIALHQSGDKTDASGVIIDAVGPDWETNRSYLKVFPNYYNWNNLDIATVVASGGSNKYGWCVYNTGFKIQWSNFITDSNRIGTFWFPVAFEADGVALCVPYGDRTDSLSVNIRSKDLNGATFLVNDSTNMACVGIGCHCIAFGI